jgi:propionate CoA-transferase
VLRLGPDGLVLEEVAQGVDLEKDVLSKMEFAPSVAKDLREMDPRLFRPGPMDLAKELEWAADARRA